jgi:transcriptional regulator with XRE-family HTH domain
MVGVTMLWVHPSELAAARVRLVGTAALDDNFGRLIGMHGRRAREAAGLLGVSAQTVSGWLNQHSRPSFDAGLKITEFFEVPADRLVNDSFADLLDVLSDKERYERVEAKITRKKLKSVS